MELNESRCIFKTQNEKLGYDSGVGLNQRRLIHYIFVNRWICEKKYSVLAIQLQKLFLFMYGCQRAEKSLCLLFANYFFKVSAFVIKSFFFHSFYLYYPWKVTAKQKITPTSKHWARLDGNDLLQFWAKITY